MQPAMVRGGRILSGFHVGAGARHMEKGRTIMNVIEPKIIVVANLQRDVPGLLAQADGVVAGFEGHPAYFPNADPVVKAIKDARKTLGDTHTTTAPLKKAGQARSPAERALRNKLTDGARFAETCANNDLANAPAIVAASTFSQKARSTRAKHPLTLTYGEASGTVLADAKAAKRGNSAFYSWRYSLDNGQTWVEVAQTNISRTLLDGLPVGKTVLVQVALTQQNVGGSWSDTASILVH
jgi:hypothetical protein